MTDFRREIDLLESRRWVDAARMRYVGHSLGASVGDQFAGVEKRVKARVLVAGFGDTARGWNMARPNDEFLRLVAPLDGVRYVGAAPPSAILFQGASRDEVLTAEDLEIFFDAAKEPKEQRCAAGATACFYPA